MFTNIKYRYRNIVKSGIYYTYLMFLVLILFGWLMGFDYILIIKWIVYVLLSCNIILTIYVMIFIWNSIHMSTSFISDIIKFIKNGFYLDINDAKSYLSIFIIKFINTKWSLFFTLLSLGLASFIFIFIFIFFYYTFNPIIYSVLAILYFIYLLFIHFKELSINKNNNISNSKFLRIIYEFKFMNINLAPIAVLIQLINSGRFNSILLFIIGILIILIINVIITSQSFINLIIKIENLIINLFFVFNSVFNILQKGGSNISISNMKLPRRNEHRFYVRIKIR